MENRREKNRWEMFSALMRFINPKLSEKEKEYEKYISLLSQARFWAEAGEPSIEQGILKILNEAVDRKITRFESVRLAELALKAEADEYLDSLTKLKTILK